MFMPLAASRLPATPAVPPAPSLAPPPLLPAPPPAAPDLLPARRPPSFVPLAWLLVLELKL